MCPCVYKHREGEGVHELEREANYTYQPEVLCFDTRLSRGAEVLVGTSPSAREKENTPDKKRKHVCVRAEKERERKRAREKKREREQQQPHLSAKVGGRGFFE